MSNVFDVLQKIGSFDFGEVPEELNAENGPASVLLPLVTEAAPLSSANPRTVQLQVSTTAPIFPFEENESPGAEQYRIVRTKILHHPGNPRLLAISSASSGDGKTISSINIAAALALKQDTTVLLIDADLRRRNIAKVLGISSSPGLSEVLCGVSEIDDALVQAEQFPNLFILAAGDIQASPAELLDSERLRALLAQMKQRFQYVILDATPVAAVADYELIERACDGIIAIARPGHSDRSTCMNLLRSVPKEKLVGIVLNHVEDWWLWKTPQYRYYGIKQ